MPSPWLTTPFIEIFVDAGSLEYAEELVLSTTSSVSNVTLKELIHATVKPYLQRHNLEVNVSDCRVNVDAHLQYGRSKRNANTQFVKELSNGGLDKKTTKSCEEGQFAARIPQLLESPLTKPLCKHILVATATPLENIPKNAKLTVAKCLPGYIPVNTQSQRIDVDLEPNPTDAYMDEYVKYEKTTGKSPCLKHHLEGTCLDVEACWSGHSEVSDEVFSTARAIAQRMDCRGGSACRRVACCYGHACRDQECDGKCRFAAHHIDETVHH